SCANEAATIQITSSCSGFKTAYLYIGSFTPTTSQVNIAFDYGYERASGITSSLRVRLRNLTAGSDQDLIFATSDVDASYNNLVTVNPGDVYELQAIFFATNYYSFSHGATIDHVVVSSPCTQPSATISTVDDCGNGRYQVQVQVSATGSASGLDIDADGSTAYTNVGPGTYLLPSAGTYYTAGTAHDVALDGSNYGGCPGPTGRYAGCQADTCGAAYDILGRTESGDLAAANIDAPAALLPNWLSCGNGTTLANCSWGNTHFAYDYTDFTDLWYYVDIPDGSDEFTVTMSNLTGTVMVIPYSGTCGALTPLPMDNSPSSVTNGNCPIFSTDGSLTYTNVSAYSTSPIYLRVIPHDDGNFGAAGCSGNFFNYAAFDITASAPQPNDVCSDAIDITTNFGGASSDGDLSQAADEGNDLPLSGLCDGTAIATNGEDLWLAVNMPVAQPVKNIQFSLTFANAGETVYAALYDGGCYDFDDPEMCAVMTSSTAGETVTVTWDPGAALISSKTYKIRLIRPATNGLSAYTASALLLDRNNTCELFNNFIITYRLHDGTNPVVQSADYTFAENSGVPFPSGATPSAVQSDLWYNVDPVLTTDGNGLQTWSGELDIDVNGLGGSEALAILVYRRHGYSGNCVDYAGDFVDSIAVTADGTTTLGCLDLDHGGSGVGDGYLVRVVQTAGGSPATIDISATPRTNGPPTNDICSKIISGGSVTFEGAFYDLTNDTISADFSFARNCGGVSDACGGVSLAKDKDLWFLFTLPTANCPDLTSSSRITTASVFYDAGTSFRDAQVFVYTDCTGDSVLACGALDGAGDDLPVSGLEPGTTYLVRVMPHALNSVENYSFDVGVRLGAVRPCNDAPHLAAAGPAVQTGLDRSNCPTLTFSAQGATPTSNIADGRNDVWYSFVAPNNGGPYVQQEGYLSVFLESVSGHQLNVAIYEVVGDNVASNQLGNETTDPFNEARLHVGHLVPGKTYYLRISHQEGNTSLNNVDVRYRFCLFETQNIDGCPSTGTLNHAPVGIECGNSCSKFYKIDLPEDAPSAFYRIEVIGDGLQLGSRLRYQGMDSPSNEGNLTDIDHPCNAGGNVPLLNSGGLTDPGTCNGG
ncbi:MAG: hypothetical protein AAF570_06650, partial [Bacteroidota bacterium]